MSDDRNINNKFDIVNMASNIYMKFYCFNRRTFLTNEMKQIACSYTIIAWLTAS